MSSLAGIDVNEVDRLVEQIPAMRESIHRSALENFVPEDVCFQAASLLEAELGMALVEASRWDEADVHFDAGWRVSFLLDAPREQLRFQRDWLLAVGLFHQQRIFMGRDPQPAFERADRFLENAARRYPGDFEVLMATGAVLEFSGSLREGDRDHLKRAESLYAQALRVAPDEPEALLRYGRVLKKRGKTREAEAPLRRVLELTAGDYLIYIARMALGGLAETTGRLDEALTQYEAATRVEPTWQVAYLAWSEALRRKGAHSQPREILDQALGVGASEVRNDDGRARSLAPGPAGARQPHASPSHGHQRERGRLVETDSYERLQKLFLEILDEMKTRYLLTYSPPNRFERAGTRSR